MSQHASDNQMIVWQRLVESHRAYSRASHDFLADKAERVELLRKALRGKDRDVALAVAPSLTTDELKQLFSEWVNLARCAHSPFKPAWDVILSLPREWVLQHIEPEVDAILRDEEEDDYWMFLQLYERLDRDLTLQLARRAAAHANPDIRELGEDCLARLSAPEASGG
jgi:hypothetical protein